MSTGAQGEPAVVLLHSCELPKPHVLDKFDLKDILTALDERVVGWQWWIESNTEATSNGTEHGTPIEAVWRALEDLLQRYQSRTLCEGVWLSGQDFDCYARAILQTIDGQFQAFPPDIEPGTITLDELWAPFHQSRADLVICIRDGCLFEVYAKQAQDIARPRTRFPDFHLEDSSRYF